MVEIIPKQTPGTASWLNGLFYFSLALLLISVIAFFFLDNTLERNQVALMDLDQALVEVRNPESLVLEKEIIGTQRKIDSFLKLKGGHLEPSLLFRIIEENAHPQVWFSKLNFDRDKGKVTLGGETASFETLGQQLLIFQEATGVKQASLVETSISKAGRVDFSLSLEFTQEVLPEITEGIYE